MMRDIQSLYSAASDPHHPSKHPSRNNGASEHGLRRTPFSGHDRRRSLRGDTTEGYI